MVVAGQQRTVYPAWVCRPLCRELWLWVQAGWQCGWSRNPEHPGSGFQLLLNDFVTLEVVMHKLTIRKIIKPVLLITSLLSPLPVLAHAILVKSQPAKDETVSQSPTQS